MDHYINTQATDLTHARVASLVNNAQTKPFPTLAYGDNSLHNFYFENNGAIESFSGNAAYGLRVTLGEPVNGPSSGNFTLTFGALTTSPIDSQAAASDVAAALNALSSVTAAGGVSVTGENPNFIIAFNATGAQGAMTAAAALLVPESSIPVTVLTTGDASHSQKLLVTLSQNLLFQSTSWTTVTSPNNGWTGKIATNSAAALALLMEEGTLVGDFLQVETVITVEVIQTDGTFITYLQTPVLIRAKASAVAGGAPSGAQVVQGGNASCTNGALTDTFSFSNPFLSSVIGMNQPVIVPPTGGDLIECFVTAITKTGFTVAYGEAIPAAGYKIYFLAIGS